MGIGNAIGGVLGGLASSSGDGGASDNYKYIQQLYQKLQDPNFDMSSLTPEEQQVAGQLTPEAMQALQMPGATTVNPGTQGRDAQMGALKQLQGLSQGGLNMQDQADLRQIQNQAATANQGRQGAIAQEAAARGVAGGGQEMEQKMMAAQNAYNQQSANGLNVAGQAQARALQALQMSGQLGGQVQSADTGLAGQNADIINQFNAANFANRQNISNQNVNNRNNAQQYNLNNAQSVANSNVSTNNAFKQYNQQNQNQLKQQQFGNEMAKIGGQAGQASGLAQSAAATQAANNARTQGIFKGLGDVGEMAATGGASAAAPSGGNFAGGDPDYKKYFA